MDHLTIESRHVAESYLLGQLPPKEARRFEEHFLDCSECLEKLELSRRLRDGLKDVAAEDGAQLARSALLAWLLRRRRALRAGIAAAVLALAILPAAILLPRTSRLAGEQERLAGELARVLAPQVRSPTYSLSPERSAPGDDPSTRIVLGTAPEWVVLALELPPTIAAADYRVRLRQTGGETLWRSAQPTSGGGRRLEFSVHSSWLEAGDYTVELDVLGAAGDLQSSIRFDFAVRHEDETTNSQRKR